MILTCQICFSCVFRTYEGNHKRKAGNMFQWKYMGLGVRTGILTNIYQLHDFGRDVLNLHAKIFIFVKFRKYALLCGTVKIE